MEGLGVLLLVGLAAGYLGWRAWRTVGGGRSGGAGGGCGCGSPKAGCGPKVPEGPH